MNYHEFVFDETRRKFRGEFEKMYVEADRCGTDPWRQDQVGTLPNQVLLAITETWPKSSLWDLGCGKGALSHCLAAQGFTVTGLDISLTALKVAKRRTPEATFVRMDLRDFRSLTSLLTPPPPQPSYPASRESA